MGVRQTLQGTAVNVIEVVPPYVEGTELTAELGDTFKNLKGMGLEEFVDDIFAVLEATPARNLKEVAAGSAVPRVQAWRGSIGELLVQSGLGG